MEEQRHGLPAPLQRIAAGAVLRKPVDRSVGLAIGVRIAPADEDQTVRQPRSRRSRGGGSSCSRFHSRGGRLSVGRWERRFIGGGHVAIVATALIPLTIGPISFCGAQNARKIDASIRL